MAKYKRGANFERDVLKDLIGDNTDTTKGYLHSLLPLLKHPSKNTLPLVYGIRSAGSRGFFDLLITFTYPCGTGFVLGVQCKIGVQSEKRMDSDLRKIKKLTNVHGVYALKVKGSKQPKYYPEISSILPLLWTGEKK